MKVLVLLGQMKHSRVDNTQATIIAEELAKGGTLYKKEVYFNMFIRLPNIILSFLPVWLLIKHIDDFKDIEDCDAIVVSGKKMIRYAKHLRKYAFPEAKIVQIGNTNCPLRKTDILLKQATSKRVWPRKLNIDVNGLICDEVDAEIAKTETEKFKKIKSYLKGEFIGVFISGKSFMFDLNSNDAIEFAKTISRISYLMKMPLLVFADKNVNKSIVNLIKENLDCSYYFYSKKENPDENPKVAFMSWASFYVLLGNSINDHSEYLSQGKPTYVFKCKNNTKKYVDFIDYAISNGCCAELTSGSENLTYYAPKKLNNIVAIVNEIKKMM